MFWRQPAVAGTGPLFVIPQMQGVNELKSSLFVSGELNEAVSTAVDKFFVSEHRNKAASYVLKYVTHTNTYSSIWIIAK